MVAAALTLISPITDQSSFTMSHIEAPIAYISFLVVFVEMVTFSMTLVLLPVSDIKLIVIEETFALLAFAQVFFPVALVFVASEPFTIRTDVIAPTISIVRCIDLPFVSIPISIMYLDGLAYAFAHPGSIRRLVGIAEAGASFTFSL